MASINEIRMQQQQKAQWAQCDPLTLVHAAHVALYQEVSQSERENLAPLEEVISRFEQTIRASMATTSTFTQSGGGGSSS